MKVSFLALSQYRNIGQISQEFHPDVNLIFGENAQGKTSLLESLVYLSTGKSHRTTVEKDLIKFGMEGTSICAKIDSFQREYILDATLQLGKRRKLARNQVKVTKFSEFSEVFHTVLFCPEDLSLVRSGSLARRRFLDHAIGQLRPNYNKAMADYKKLYIHKSKILREKSPNLMKTLGDFNFRMAQVGAMIVHYRAHFVKRLQETVPPIHEEFAGGKEEISLEYHSVSTINDTLVGEQKIFEQILAHQESHYQAELASARCLTGPHKDDLILKVNGNVAKQFASQGQTRTFALALKLGEREIFFRETGEYPVLLLDDVLSELDRSRQEFVLNKIKTGQVFITSCEDENFLGLKEGEKFQINQGRIVH